MREVYKNASENSPTSPVETIKEGEESEAANWDPFYDRFPWFRLIGRGYVYIANLLHSLTLIQKIPIINERGDVKGYLRVAVQAVTGTDEDTLPDFPGNSVGAGFRQSAKVAFDPNDDTLKELQNSLESKHECNSFYPKYLTRYSDLNPIDQVNNNYQSVDLEDDEDEESGDEDGMKVKGSESKRREKGRKKSELKLGSEFTFRVIILQIIGIQKEYRDVFCQFNFLHKQNEAFSTEPIKNSGTGPSPGFFRIQNITVTVTPKLIDYLLTQPILFEVFGHFQQHPLDRESRDTTDLFVPGQTCDRNGQRQAPRRMFPQQIPISQPLRSQKFSHLIQAMNGSQVHAKFDILVWFEICELASSGEYIPVVVDHDDETPCKGTFLLHQGIQRRIRITIVHDTESDVRWKEIRELVVGRVRNEAEIAEDFDDDQDESVLSLSLFHGEHLPLIDDRTVFRFEAAWDTSLHWLVMIFFLTSHFPSLSLFHFFLFLIFLLSHIFSFRNELLIMFVSYESSSLLLNRETPSGERVFLTLSAYLDVSKFQKVVSELIKK